MTEKDIAELTSHLGYWLRFVSNHVSQGFAHRIEERGVTVAEWVVMRELFDVEDTAPSLVADRLNMTRGAISKLADRLVAKSLATRTASNGDRRYQTLALTAKGRALVPQLAALADENDAEFFDHLNPQDRQALLRIMQDIVTRRGLKTTPIS